MNKKRFSYPGILIWLFILFLAGCNDSKRPPGSDIVSSPEQLTKKATDYIRETLDYAKENKGDIGDSVFLLNDSLVRFAYKDNYYGIIWSNKEQLKPTGDSLVSMIENAKFYGLFPSDYHLKQINTILKRFKDDSLGKTDRLDVALWSRADLMMTDALLQIVKDIKQGRLPKDSISLNADSILSGDFYLKQLNAVKQTGSLSKVLENLEPRIKGYQLLKASLKNFLDSARDRPFTMVPLPGKDTAGFKRALQTRLYEGRFIAQDSVTVDSVTIAEAIKRFQRRENITVDGKAGAATVRMLNLSDSEKFVRIAITLDRYKKLPENMPSRYVWVNLPAFNMQLIDGDSVKLRSKIICGKPATRTPVLTSAIGQLITYPQWTIPTSIIVKEVLPGAKKDPGYFAKKGYSIIDKDGNEVDPYTVEWSKYKKGIPYKVIQGSGDDNALGILKFNFNNKYAVYLHDTNQRYLFAQAVRALSHGCVRVQQWQQLAYAIIRYDNPDSTKTSPKEDSLNSWLKQKIKRSIYIKNKLPLFIRYFTCEGSDKGIVFYDDMYGEDKYLREKYFAGK